MVLQLGGCGRVGDCRNIFWWRESVSAGSLFFFVWSCLTVVLGGAFPVFTGFVDHVWVLLVRVWVLLLPVGGVVCGWLVVVVEGGARLSSGGRVCSWVTA